jgi:hypothetical protein
MQFIEKVASYFETYTTSNVKDGVVKVASEDGVSPDELVAFHNLVHGNIFTGENLIKTASEEPDSKIIALGLMFDKLASEENITIDDIYAYADSELGMDEEDVDFVYVNIEKQAEEAGLLDNQNAEENTDELVDKIAEAMTYLADNGIEPVDGLFIGANLAEDNLIADEKVAEEAAEAGFEPEDLQKIAEAVEFIGKVDEEVLEIAHAIAES